MRELGAQISADYAGRSVTLVSVLKGSLPFMADLMRAIEVPVQIDLMEVSSYGGATTETSGLVRILKDLSSSIAGRDVLIVEDIIDTGLTLNYLLRYLRGKNPASLRICALLDKPARRLVEIPIDYTRLHDPRRVRRWLRPRLRRVLPQPAVHRRPAPGAVRDAVSEARRRGLENLREESLRPLVLRVVEKLDRRPFFDDHPVVEHHHAVGRLASEAHLVTDDDHRHAFVGELLHHRKHLADHLGVERAGRLVEEHQGRPHRQRARDRHALLLAA